MIDFYTANSSNGQRAAIMLEECALPYTLHKLDLFAGEQGKPEFLAVNPAGAIPVIVDSDGPGGSPLTVAQSGAILVYLAEKAGALIPGGAAARYETLQWLMFQMGGIGPMFGQVGFFVKFAGREFEDKRPRDRYVSEAKRLLAVLEQRLEGREWIMGREYSIADIATFPWVRNLVGFYGAGDLVGFERFANVQRVLDEFAKRPAVQKGLAIPPRD